MAERKKPDYTGVLVAAIGIGLALLFWGAAKGFRGSDDDDRPQPQGPMQPQPPSIINPIRTRTENATWTFDNGVDEKRGRALASRLFESCVAGVINDVHRREVWDLIDKVEVDHRTVYAGGRDVWIWEVVVDVNDDRAHFDVVRGNRLYFRISDDGELVAPTKSIANELCGGGYPVDKMTPWAGGQSIGYEMLPRAK